MVSRGQLLVGGGVEEPADGGVGPARRDPGSQGSLAVMQGEESRDSSCALVPRETPTGLLSPAILMMQLGPVSKMPCTGTKLYLIIRLCNLIFNSGCV